MSIQLHPTKGVNSFMTYCRRCGGDAEELILVGRKQYKDICGNCGGVHIGGSDRPSYCKLCKQNYVSFTREKFDDGTRLPSSQPCDKCLEQIKEHEVVVSAGGIYWKCGVCGVGGVINANEFTWAVRKTHNLMNGEPCGVELNHTDQPRCPKADEDT